MGAVSAAKSALWPWLGVLASLSVTLTVYILVRVFGTFCSTSDEAQICLEKHATLTCTVLMACLWVVGKPHSAVVALLPVILLPLMGVGGHRYGLEHQYFNKVNFILLGSFLLAFAIEEVGLHHRLALKLLSIVPGDPKMVLLAMMTISAFLSAFMSNTATASLMCPLATSLYEEMKEVGAQEPPCTESEESTSDDSNEMQMTRTKEPETDTRLDHLFKKIVLGVAYACTIGGVSTKTGTGTNLAFASIYGNLTGQTISFGRWILFAFPMSLTLLVVAWMLLISFGGGLGRGLHFPTHSLRQRYEKLGSITRQEMMVAALCVLTILGWFFRAPAWGHGYAELFPDPDDITDATVVMALTLPLFFLPGKEGPILQWHKIQGKMPMGLFLLIGAGSAISAAFDKSGLSEEIGEEMKTAADHLPMVLFQLACMTMAALMSQATSDVAVANILLPITYGVALSLEVDPLLLMLPVGLACSLPFMLVVSTPPNAIAFQTGFITQRDLLCFGAPLTLCGLFVMFGFCFPIAFRVLGLDR